MDKYFEVINMSRVSCF